MRSKRLWSVLGLLAVLALVAAACGGGGKGGATGATGGATGATGAAGQGVCATVDPNAGDLLARICKDGVIRVSTDPAYPPQSFLNEQTGEFEGFDIDVATEIAKRLGVKVDWKTPSWDLITAGGWNDRWDMSVGSMTPTAERQQVLYFTQPYYYTPAVVVVREDDTSVSDLSTDLDGKRIGVCSACTYEFYLEKTLNIPGYTFDFIIDDAKVSGYDTDTTALQDLVLGRLDAVITSMTTAQGYIDAGNPVKIVGDPVFYEPLAVAFDKKAPLDPTSLVKAVDTIVGDMHADGTLTELSKNWYNGLDLTVQI